MIKAKSTLIAVAICLASFLSSNCLVAQSQSFVPSSAFAAFSVKPKSALAQPAMELIPRELIQVFGQQEMGLDLLEITNITSLVDGNISKEEPPKAAAIIRFDSPQKLSPKILDQFVRQELSDGMTFYGQGDFEGRDDPRLDSEPGLVIVDEQTMIFGSRGMVKKMLNSKGARSPLISHLASVPESDHLNLFFTVEPVRAMLKDSLPPREQVPPQFRNLLKLPDLIQSVALRSDFSNERSQLVIGTSDSKSADEINRIVKQGIQNAKQIILTMAAAEIEFPNEAYQQAAIKYADRVADYIQNEMKPMVHEQKDGGVHLVYDLKSASGSTGLATSGILVGMLLPAVQQVREAARRTSSMNNIRQFLLASLNYESAHLHMPMNANYDENGKPLLSWRVHLLPYMEENRLYEQFHLDEPWNSEHNIKLLDQMPAIFQNPNMDLGNKTNFLAVTGPGTVFPGNEKVRIRDVIDGLSNTVMMIEVAPEFAVEWTKPVDYVLDTDNPRNGIGRMRPAGVVAGRCDGSVFLVPHSATDQVLIWLFKIADGNIVPDFLP